jgi:hypothetical protein
MDKSIEKFLELLTSDEKKLLSTYSSQETYDKLSDKFDEILKSNDEDKQD